MPQPTSPQRMNRPVWNPTTIVQAVVLTGGVDAVVVSGYYVIICNIGANIAGISPNPAVPGVILQPGETFETAIMPGSPLHVSGTAGQMLSVIEYKDQ